MNPRYAVACLAALALASTVAASARADACTGWFCDDAAKSPDPAAAPQGFVASDALGDVGVATVLPGVPGLAPGVLSGTITELVPGDHLTLQLPGGGLQTLAWGQLLRLQVSGKIVIGGAPSATIPVASAPSATPAVVVVSPPPPAPVVVPPLESASPPAEPTSAHDVGALPYPYRHRPAFEERWTLGLGLSFLSPNDRSTFAKGGPGVRDYVGGGTAVEASLGYRLSPAWTPYGFFEYGRFRSGTANADVRDAASGTMLGLGLRANTHPDAPIGFFFDFGFGYRTLNVRASGSELQFSGWDYLRLGAGLAFDAGTHARWHVALVGSAGSFSRVRGAQQEGCVDRCSEIAEPDRGSYGFGGLTLGGQYDL